MSNHDINHHIYRLKESFLVAAARGGRISECASLLEFGAELEWHENNEDTPLLSAVRNGHQDVAGLLLAHGANPSIRDRDGNTVMHLAAAIGDESMAILFAPNAALSLRTNFDGMTAIDVAVERGFNSFAERLNNLLHNLAGEDRGEVDEVTSEASRNNLSSGDTITDAIDDSENDFADEYDSNEVSFSTPDRNEVQFSTSADRNELEHTSTSITREESIIDKVGESDGAISDFETWDDDPSPDALMKQLRHMTSNLAHKSIPELSSLEEQVKRSLDKIVKAKEMASTNLEEERVCVICRENPKSVLLMNCRHLCVCKECGHLDVLVRCPLCREIITERINVFA